MPPTQTKKAKRRKLYREQDGRCWYCKCEMLLIDNPQPGQVPVTMATFEHLDSRLSEYRGKHPGERRVVLACWQCNQEKGAEDQQRMSKAELQLRSKRHSGEQFDDLLMCHLVSVTYYPETKLCELRVPEGECCDMVGAIVYVTNRWRSTRIEVVSGDDLINVYLKTGRRRKDYHKSHQAQGWISLDTPAGSRQRWAAAPRARHAAAAGTACRHAAGERHSGFHLTHEPAAGTIADAHT